MITEGAPRIVEVEALTKVFKLPKERTSSLKQTVLNFRRRSFSNFEVLKGIDFDVKEGEFFGIVGRNGSGKSTLLKILAGIYTPSSGKVVVNGRLTPFIELGVGFNMELTGRENVFLNGVLLGLSHKEIKQKYHEIVGFAELEEFMDQKLKNYSSGMLVRLAFSIAIQAHSDILLIDEVLAVGDASFQRKCYEVFKNIKKTSKTVIFVSHDMGAIQEYCDRALMIEKGNIVSIGQPREVALRYEIANAASASSKGDANISRPHNPPCQLEAITVRAEKKQTHHFTIDDDIIVDIDFNVREAMDPIQFNLFLVGMDGKYVAGINTTGDLGEYRPGPGKHRIQCRIKAGQLVKNDYIVNVAVYSHAEPPKLIDIMDASYGVEVPRISMLDRSPTQNGEFNLKAGWSKLKAS